MRVSNPAIAGLIVAALMVATIVSARAAPSPVAFAGADETTCAECHAGAVEAWQGSHHARAMQHASPATVLGTFEGQVLTHAGERTLVSRRGETFLVTISSSDSKAAAEQYEVLYTFGIAPLQQYLVATEPDRLQALPWAWDTRPEAEGGGRWYHLYEKDTVPPGDRLHWKSPLQNWNGMCADCHSTGLARNYNVSGDHFATTAASINISCASCHGDAADHLFAMQQETKPPSGSFDDVIGFSDLATSRFERAAGEATASNRSAPHQGREIEVCAACHSRRTPLTSKIDPAAPFLDQFTPDLLDEGLYYPDGQIREEVYVWGSFMQSKMAAAGVTCSHCHDAHALTLKRGGNALCSSCHAPEVFDTSDHHHHLPTSEGAQCVSCHMPQTTYMGIDARRDHSFKVPRPGLSQSLGTPNACTSCHTDMTNEAAAAHISAWYEPRKADNRATQTIAAARARDPAARTALLALIEDETGPAIIRATALSLIANVPGRALMTVALSHLGDTDPLIRIGAIRALTILAPQQRVDALAPLLGDPVKSVRMETAVALQDVSASVFSGDDRIRFEAVIAEHLKANGEIAWRGEGRLNRGLIHQSQGELDKASHHYKKSIGIDPGFTPSYINLSELLRTSGTIGGAEEETRATLLQGLAAAPDDAALEHALGLALIRAGKAEKAMTHLARAANLAPQTPRFAYVHAVALHSVGNTPEARTRLQAALAHHPYDPDLLTLGFSLADETGDRAAMRIYARQLAEISPDDPNWPDRLRRLRQN